jgi:hypothetical protein
MFETMSMKEDRHRSTVRSNCELYQILNCTGSRDSLVDVFT